MKRTLINTFLLLVLSHTVANALTNKSIKDYVYAYTLRHFDLSASPECESFSTEIYCFSEEEVVFNGKKYLQFINKESEKEMALIRVEDEKAYILITESLLENYRWINDHTDGNATLPGIGNEVLIWDFEVAENSYYDSLFIAYMPVNTTNSKSILLTINKAWMAEISEDSFWGSKRKIAKIFPERENSESRYIIEGLGPTHGYLFAPKFLMLDGSGTEVYLYKVTDRAGTIIYEDPTNDPSVGLQEMSVDGTVVAGRKYDVMGREIKHPESGSIYIQDGRKYIAR